ncbi:MAG: DEAD/DEAH box helicase [Succinatimonas sp.]|nr:DEAD/DEAH box helicase [Succinatimonas sp.]
MSDQDLNLQNSISEQEQLENNEVKAQPKASESEITVTTGGAESLFMANADEEDDLAVFDDLPLSEEVLKAVKSLGFEAPTPIQERAIPVIMEGHDILGQAQTGTGKTAAFSLPLLSKIDSSKGYIQALILEPTRELAIQVAEACQSFAKYIEDFRVAPIYGGASYENQIRSLRHGASVVVATPGRLIDLLERGKIDLNQVSFIVIDEADEMLRMGFIDDVDWILSNTPEERQTALFSATMPEAIARIAKNHLQNPVDVRIESKTTTATTVHQRYWIASGVHKIDAMTRILEVEDYDAVLVFVRTKTDAEDVANRLMGRGLACAALHGDIPQRQREKIIDRLKNKQLDIIIATDVAARGLDVDRITHVFNYDIPYDAESYVHRIGRTGRAGRTGEAILFVSPRERRALRQIERVTHQQIEPMSMPTIADVNRVRLENFRNQIMETIAEGGLEQFEEVISEILTDDSIEPELLAAALAKMAQRDGTLLLDESKPEPRTRSFDDDRERRPREDRSRDDRQRRVPSAQPQPLRDFPDMQMTRFRLAVGRRDGAKPGQIVGAIANEGNLESKYIGEIAIFDTFTTVDLPAGMPEETMRILAAARVCGRPLDLREYTAEPPRSHRQDRGNFRGERNFNNRDFDRSGNRSGRDFHGFQGDDRGNRRDDRRGNRRFERPSFSFNDRRERSSRFDRNNNRGNFSGGRREGF